MVKNKKVAVFGWRWNHPSKLWNLLHWQRFRCQNRRENCMAQNGVQFFLSCVPQSFAFTNVFSSDWFAVRWQSDAWRFVLIPISFWFFSLQIYSEVVYIRWVWTATRQSEGWLDEPSIWVQRAAYRHWTGTGGHDKRNDSRRYFAGNNCWCDSISGFPMWDFLFGADRCMLAILC